MNNVWHTIGRIIYGLPFIIFGIFHFLNGADMAGYVPGFIPGGAFWVYLTGAALIAAGISILIQKMTRLACILLGVMLLIFVLTIHLPAVINAADMQAMQQAMPSLLKDLALAGAAWFMAGNYGSESVTE
jgi:uncharacterized membrane protein YphA (DoxX/SURF4 family)